MNINRPTFFPPNRTCTIEQANPGSNAQQLRSLDQLPQAPNAGEGTGGTGDVPNLPPSSGSPTIASGATPSLGATMLALIGSLSDEMRRSNTEARMADTQSVVMKMHEQADSLRKQAVVGLALGIASAVVNIGASLSSAIGIGKALKNAGGLFGQMSESQMTMMRTKTEIIEAASGAVKGAAGIIDQTNQFLQTQMEADRKMADAAIELLRADRDQLDSLDKALNDLIAKARDTQDRIQENVNQTRTKILT